MTTAGRAHIKRLALGMFFFAAYYGPAYACATFYPNSGQGYSQIYNGCSYKVFVTWSDQGYCSTGCSAYVGPGQTQNITELQGQYSGREQRWP